jgi:hypothetical protein
MESKRSQYRVRQDAGAMRVTLHAAAGSIEGEVLNLSVQGSGGRFAERDMPQVTPGERVRLEFSTLLLIEPLVAEAVVRRIDTVGGELLIGFEFTDPQGVLRDVPYVLRPRFNRRRYLRVQIDEPLAVQISAAGLALEGWLRQISVGGAAVSVPLEVAGRLARGDQIEMRLRLPGQSAALCLSALVRGLWRDGDGLGCSLRFDPTGTENYAAQRAAIRAFVAGRRAAEAEARESEA